MSSDAGLDRLRKNLLPCHSERSEESRSGLFSRHCEIARRLGLLGMTGHGAFSATCEDQHVFRALVPSQNSFIN